MINNIQHHGIKGMHWGIRRTPEELGHPTKATHVSEKKEIAKPKDVKKMSDDELRTVVSRLNMEEQYANLVAKQKQRDTSSIKKILGDVLENLGRKSLNAAIDKLVAKMFASKKETFDIRDYDDVDLKDLDLDTIQKLSKWYSMAKIVENGRSDSSGAS